MFLKRTLWYLQSPKKKERRRTWNRLMAADLLPAKEAMGETSTVSLKRLEKVLLLHVKSVVLEGQSKKAVKEMNMEIKVGIRERD